MANISAYAQKAMLDWVLGGAAVTQPATRWIGLSLGVPSSISGSEMAVGSYSRHPITFSAASSPTGVAISSPAVTFGIAGTAATIVGWQIWDTKLTNNSGNMLWYGTLNANATVVASSAFVLGAGSVRCSLA